jgi:hypothetical protein
MDNEVSLLAMKRQNMPSACVSSCYGGRVLKMRFWGI